MKTIHKKKLEKTNLTTRNTQNYDHVKDQADSLED